MIKFEEDIILQDQQADQLVNDIKEYVNKHSLTSIHGGRFIIPNTSSTFRELLDKSEVWQKFYTFFSSEEFLNTCLEKLEMTEIDVKLNHYFSKKNTKKKSLLHKIEKLKHRQLGSLSLLPLISYVLFLVSNQILFFLHILLHRFRKGYQVDILFDISQANNGYSREIHRDSDSRLIVFLLYLNDIGNIGKGGTLDLFNYIGENQNDPDPQPQENQCKLIKSVKPEKGKLIIFRNDKFAFHSVPKMSGFKGDRIFCYGAFTITNKKNPLLNDTKKKMKTGWQMYF